MNYASILVVDDDEMIVHFFKMILEEEGYTVSEAFNGADAISYAEKKQVDLAILDYKLSDITGDKVAEALQKINPETTVVFITGYSEAKDKILRAGISKHVVVKPIRDDQLLDTVELALHDKPLTARM